MGIWTCPKCGSVYEVEFHFSPKPDEGSAECEVCGEEIVRWRRNHYYTVKMIERKEAPIKQRPEPQA